MKCQWYRVNPLNPCDQEGLYNVYNEKVPNGTPHRFCLDHAKQLQRVGNKFNGNIKIKEK